MSSISRASSNSSSLHSTPHLLTSRSSNIGIISLNKPSSLNALTLDMVRAMNSILPLWQKDPTLHATLVEGAFSEKTNKPIFCAGGDVKTLALDGISEQSNFREQGYGIRGVLSADFLREEYELNYSIAKQQSQFQKPQVSIWDGVVMGGGVGISIHGSFRVATENTLLAMPETAIGFFPDVGTTFWLSRMELSDEFKGLGMFLALTGWRLRPDDLMFADIATHYIHSSKLPDLKSNLIKRVHIPDDVKLILDEFHQSPDSDIQTLAAKSGAIKQSECFLEKNLNEIQSIFSNSEKDITISDVFQKLKTSNSQFAETVLSKLRKMSPTSLAVTVEGIQRASQMDDVGEALKMEYRVSQGFMRHCGPSLKVADDNSNNDISSIDSDFYEGIRAVLIDKDHKANWNPETIDNIDPKQVIQRYFKEGILQEELTFGSDDAQNASSKL